MAARDYYDTAQFLRRMSYDGLLLFRVGLGECHLCLQDIQRTTAS